MLVKYTDENNDFFKKGSTYLALEVFIDFNKNIIYGIQNPQNNRVVIAGKAEKFEMIDSSIPSSWGIKVDNEKLFLGPKRWLDDNLWNDSFWEDYYGVNGNIPTEEAVRVFKEELEIMKREAGLLDEDKQEEDW